MDNSGEEPTDLVDAWVTVCAWRRKFQEYGTTLVSCGCPAALFRPNTPCRHVEALRALQAVGALPRAGAQK